MRKMFGFGLSVAVALIVILSVGVARPTLAQGPFLVGIDNTTNVYDAPNINADLIGQLTAGQNWYIFGTDTTGNWIEVEVTTSVSGWAPKSAFGVGGLTLPVISGVTGGSLTTTAASGSVTVTTTAVPTTVAPTTAAPTTVATTVAPVTTTQGTPVAVPYFVTVISTTNGYDSPSTKGNVIGVLTAGQTWFVLGTDTTGKWAEVQVAGTATVFWVPVSNLSLAGVVLPVIPGVTGS